ncbi:MAG: DMT family transporter [Notoacmeibacter sp.]|nr:DMT family transporter [Notoacmeibacter sp.]MCC0031672.1 DMT family transporter [Brucellaceae bacterium]
MSGWLALLVTMAVAGRETATRLDVFQVMEIRALAGFVMLLPLVLASGGLSAMRTAHPVRHVSRNIVHYVAQYCWLLAVTMIPLAQVISIEFTMPIWTAILAVFVLGETMNPYKIAAIVLGLAGVLIIVRPDAGHADPGQLISLASAAGFSISVILVKSLTRTDKPIVIIFWMLIIQAVIGLVPALMVWKPVPEGLWPWLLVVAFCGTFSHLCMAKAMTHADATVVVPMDFLRVPLTALAGYMVYAEGIDTLTMAGAALILTGNLLNLKRGGRAQAADGLRRQE